MEIEIHAADAERLIVSGVIGTRPDGNLETGLRAQMERAWLNLHETIDAAGFGIGDVLRITAYATEPGRIQLFRDIADRMLDGHSCPCAYRQVSGLGIPQILFELEAEAIRRMTGDTAELRNESRSLGASSDPPARKIHAKETANPAE